MWRIILPKFHVLNSNSLEAVNEYINISVDIYANKYTKSNYSYKSGVPKVHRV